MHTWQPWSYLEMRQEGLGQKVFGKNGHVRLKNSSFSHPSTWMLSAAFLLGDYGQGQRRENGRQRLSLPYHVCLMGFIHFSWEPRCWVLLSPHSASGTLSTGGCSQEEILSFLLTQFCGIWGRPAMGSHSTSSHFPTFSAILWELFHVLLILCFKQPSDVVRAGIVLFIAKIVQSMQRNYPSHTAWTRTSASILNLLQCAVLVTPRVTRM